MNFNYRDLKSYIPKIYEEVDEIEAILEVEEPLFEGFEESIEKAFNNTFILKADSEGLKLFENILKIVSTPSESLDFRRFRIINRMSLKPPLTIRWLRSVIDEVVGDEEYTCIMDYPQYTLHVNVMARDRSWYDELYYTLYQSLPANIKLDLSNNVFVNVDHQIVSTHLTTTCKIINV